jgi:medium-chain acyl-[acyl-carrier-protein] hydrolase
MHLDSNFQFSKEFEVGSYQVHPDGKLRMNSLADFFQEIAWCHADSDDFGRNLLEDNLSWVLSRFDIKAVNLPSWGETIRVFTAGRGVDKLFAFREFLITDLDGKPLAQAMSSWVLLNTVSKKLHRPEQVLPVALFDPYLKPDWQPERIRMSGKLQNEEEVKVKYSDLDLNNHVNNTVYIRWIEDFFKENNIDPSHLLINYLAECVLGDIVKIELFESDGKFQFQGKVLDKLVFLAETLS